MDIWCTRTGLLPETFVSGTSVSWNWFVHWKGMVKGMPDNILGMTAVLLVCGAVLIMGVMKGKMEWLLNILMRSILGTIAIYFINNGLAAAGIDLGVGINPITVLTSGILGFPGLAVIYGLGFYQNFVSI